MLLQVYTIKYLLTMEQWGAHSVTDSIDGFREYHLTVGILGGRKGSAEPAAEGRVE